MSSTADAGLVTGSRSPAIRLVVGGVLVLLSAVAPWVQDDVLGGTAGPELGTPFVILLVIAFGTGLLLAGAWAALRPTDRRPRRIGRALAVLTVATAVLNILWIMFVLRPVTEPGTAHLTFGPFLLLIGGSLAIFGGWRLAVAAVQLR